MILDSDDVLLKTKPGCYVGVRVGRGRKDIKERYILFGPMASYDSDVGSLQLSSHVVYDTYDWSVKDVVREPRTLDVRPSQLLLGQNLMRSLGGDDTTNELLDKLEHQYNPEAHREYVRTIKAARQDEERKRKERLAEIERQQKEWKAKTSTSFAERLDDVKYGLGRFAREAIDSYVFAAKGVGFYLIGHAPRILGRALPKDVQDGYFHARLEGDPSRASINNFATVVIDGGISAAYFLAKYGGRPIDQISPTMESDPLLFGLLSATGLATGSLVARGTQVVGGAIRDEYKKIQERKAKAIRLERIRQAFCPADSEVYYEV